MWPRELGRDWASWLAVRGLLHFMPTDGPTQMYDLPTDGITVYVNIFNDVQLIGKYEFTYGLSVDNFYRRIAHR